MLLKIFKNIIILFIGVLLIIISYALLNYFKPFERINISMSLYDDVQTMIIDDQKFRDLNKNNILDVYEDHRLDAETRSEDLLNLMTI